MKSKWNALSLGLMMLTLFLTVSPVFAIELTTKAKDGFTPTFELGGRIQAFGDYSLNKTDNAFQRNRNSANFYARSVRLNTKGEIFKNIKFYAEFNFDSGSGVSLDRAYFTLSHFEFAQLSLGLLYIPFNKSYNQTSAGMQLLSDRANADTKFNHQRDTGLQINGDFMKNSLHYWAGLFVGTGVLGSNQTQNNTNGATTNPSAAGVGVARSSTGDNSYLIVGRLQFDPLGEWKNGKMWFQNDMKMSVGAGFLYTGKTEPSDTGFNTPVAQLKDVTGLTGDLGFTFKGIYLDASITYITAKWYLSTYRDKPNPYIGFKVDGGYMVLPKYLMVAVRYDYWQDRMFQYGDGGSFGYPIGSTTNNIRTSAMTIGASWYVGGHEHAMKIQPEVTFVLDKKGLQSNATGTEKKEIFARLAGTLNF